MSENLSKLREKRDDTRKQLRQIFDESLVKNDDGSKSYDFQKVECLKDDIGDASGTEKSAKVAERVQAINAELDDLCKQVEDIEGAERAAKAFEDREKALNRPPIAGSGKKEQKTIGQQIVGSDTFKNWLKGEKGGEIRLPDVGLKALFETTAGWPPESTRMGRVVDAVTRPLQITDIIPVGQTGQANVVYMEETLRTHAAAETGEGQTYAESAFELTEMTSPVRKITDSVPVTDEQLEDVAMVESYLDGRLRFGIRQRLDNQIVAGDGVAPNLRGILNTPGILTHPKGGDPVPDAFYKAMTNIRVTGRAIPTHHVMHPNDWQEIRLLRTSDGIYIWGSPSEAGPERLWGLPVVQNEVTAEGTGLTGSFDPAWISLFERRGIIIERGFTGTQFTEGKQTLRGSMRTALVIFRAPAFSTVTGI